MFLCLFVFTDSAIESPVGKILLKWEKTNYLSAITKTGNNNLIVCPTPKKRNKIRILPFVFLDLMYSLLVTHQWQFVDEGQI